MQMRPDGTDEPTDRAARRPGLGSRRVVRTSFAVSAAIHVLAVVLYPLMFERLDPSGTFFLPPPADGPPQGAQVIRLLDIEEVQDTERPEDPEQIEQVEVPEPETGVPILEGLPGVDLVPPGPTAAERLRPVLVDARLWRMPPPEFFELPLDQREELILADRISEWLDSVRIAEAAEAALTDWTFTDADGGRWGISPGKIHLGDLTLPLPFGFGTQVGQRDRTNQLVWQWEEIMRQAARAEVEMSWRERAAAIRARRDAERAAERSITRPDTTRGR